ncbi:MAG: hypothetical protein QXX12_01545 [Nanopusillaceae archaeon]
MERVVMMEGVMGGTLEIIASFPKKPLKEGITMMQKEVLFRVLNSEVSMDDLTVRLIPSRKVLNFLTPSHILDFIEDVVVSVSQYVSYAILWIESDKFILDFPEVEGKIVFHSTNQILFDIVEELCRKYIPEVIIY